MHYHQTQPVNDSIEVLSEYFWKSLLKTVLMHALLSNALFSRFSAVLYDGYKYITR